MPLYMCNAVRGVIPSEAKASIAQDITDTHNAFSEAPRSLVHVFFFDDVPKLPILGKSVFLIGTIHKGRRRADKREFLARMKESIQRHAGVSLDEIVASTTDIPASWVMEGGFILPGPREPTDSQLAGKDVIKLH